MMFRNIFPSEFLHVAYYPDKFTTRIEYRDSTFACWLLKYLNQMGYVASSVC